MADFTVTSCTVSRSIMTPEDTVDITLTAKNNFGSKLTKFGLNLCFTNADRGLSGSGYWVPVVQAETSISWANGASKTASWSITTAGEQQDGDYHVFNSEAAANGVTVKFSLDDKHSIQESPLPTLTYEKDGALWLRNTAFGAEKDEVLRRSNGFYTYYAVDLAYHRNKFVERGFDRVIDVWGADHHGHAIRFGKSMTAPELGLQGRKLDFLIMQMVRLVRDGETVKVSKRSGKALTLNDLLDEIGVDACRFFFNAKPETHLEFDLDLAVRQDSENPVYYVQYAHARICSLLATLAAEGHPVPPAESVDASVLSTPQEQELLKQLAAFPEEILIAARDYDPSRVNRYAIELAARFHRFYNACRIREADSAVQGARLVLCEAVRSVIHTALAVIGVSAPEKM